ncbi:thioredoxin domain-containing protein [Streptomyces sp. NPDC001978]|uniref:thioredoxin domain-containing protein n=1 Tax=Streptomyces sp. NPDC001978 TaxID=3364627 RepID=UPI0036748B32
MRKVRGGGVAVVAATVAVSAVALTGCGSRTVAAKGDTKKDTKAAATYDSLEELPEKLGNDGTTIVVGDQSAPVVVHLYEDPRCPVCEQFESTGGGLSVQGTMMQGQTRTEYTFASFLDDRLGGSGSKKAVNALRAALDAGKFAEYHHVLYANQPEESVDGFTTARLLELAREVDGLRSPAFDSAVRTMKYRDFVSASEDAYERAEVPGTPTAEINGVQLGYRMQAALFDPEMFRLLVGEIAADPERWQKQPF